jgi:hypothetical protein
LGGSAATAMSDAETTRAKITRERFMLILRTA